MIARDGREHLWAFLDLLDARPALKRTLAIGVPLLLIAIGLGIWGYHQWARNNALRIAHQWLDANRLDRAGIAIQSALETEPELPDPWKLASELAWRKGNRRASIDYAKKAAIVSRYQADEVLAWAEAAILSGDIEQAEEAQAYLDAATAQGSSRALRLAGEIERQNGRFADARDRFQAALEADAKAGIPTPAMDEIPLGIVLLQTGSAGDRSRGQSLLTKWMADPNWGAEALRALLADAVVHGDHEATTWWAECLQRHPRYTLGDIPVCLRALSGANPAVYQTLLTLLESKCRSSANQSAELLGWLVEIGQPDEAVRWGRTLDPAAARKPPIVVGMAESLRAAQRWADLRDCVDHGDWGGDLGFMGWAYGMLAARRLNDGARADSLWQSLHSDGLRSPAHALYAGDSLYAWGYTKEAEALLLAAADRPDLAYQAQGTLVRLYQVERNAEGQYRAFGQLHEMRPGDRKIANNFAYFGALTDMGNRTQIEHIAEDNFAHEPNSLIYRSTYAFVLVWSGHASRAISLMEPVSKAWKNSPVVAFAYGAALARDGRKSEAKEVFDSLNPHDLDTQEADWIRAAMR